MNIFWVWKKHFLNSWTILKLWKFTKFMNIFELTNIFVFEKKMSSWTIFNSQTIFTSWTNFFCKHYWVHEYFWFLSPFFKLWIFKIQEYFGIKKQILNSWRCKKIHKHCLNSWTFFGFMNIFQIHNHCLAKQMIVFEMCDHFSKFTNNFLNCGHFLCSRIFFELLTVSINKGDQNMCGSASASGAHCGRVFHNACWGLGVAPHPQGG